MEKRTFRGRDLFVLIFEILVIVVAIGGLTLATSKLMGGSRTIVSFGEYNVDYVGETEISVNDLEPISDSMINYDTVDKVVRLEFSLRGVDSNDRDDLIYDIVLEDLNIDCSLLNEYTKWNLYKNGELLYNGNFSPKFDGNVLTNNFRLTEVQQDLPSYNEEYDKYVLIIWISESCEDLLSCKIVDQSGIVNSILDMRLFIAVYTGSKTEYERVPNSDSSCINKPSLYDGMIPVYYNEGEWRVADSTNSDKDNIWYNYDESKWANAVFVNSDKYIDSKSGTVVLQSDILGYYVWIPRFKYKLWNSEKIISDTYNAYNNGIDIVFESGVNTSGNAKCVDVVCGGKNNQYLTHPAFGDNLRGFWISKYEISDGNKFVVNKESLRNKSLSEYKNIINNLSSDYGINATVDSHIVSNLEWGATLYLSHSKYGLCPLNKCISIGINDSYISEYNKKDTTTGNVYGVYDMAGATAEYVIGSLGLGTATEEVRVNEFETWDKGNYTSEVNDYIVRGGMSRGLYSVGGIEMFDVSTRAALVNK